MAGRSPSDFDRRIAGRVQTLRRQAGLTKKVCADALGISAAQFAKYEDGRNRLTGGMLQILAHVLDANVASFFDPIESPDQPAIPTSNSPICAA